MTDEQTPRSGSRWEPGPDDASVLPPATPPVPPVAQASTASPAATAPASPASPAPQRPWTQRVRGSGGLVGAALAMVLFTGVGGYALGHTAGGPDGFGIVGEQVPGGGLPAPGAGRLPPPPHGDDDGSGTPPGSGDEGGSDDGATQPGSTL